MEIKDKQICMLWRLTEKSDFQGWFTKKTIVWKRIAWIVSKFKKALGLKKGVMFLREIDTQIHIMEN